MKIIMSFGKYFLADVLFATSNDIQKKLIKEDIFRFLKWDSFKDSHTNIYVLLNHCLAIKSFRNVFYYRLSEKKIISSICKFFIPELKTIEIGGQIDGGLLVSHNFSVIIPQCAGKNLRIGPGVVVGRNAKGFPVIGDNVYIASNSTVVGNIHIGNNVIIGAGSVVIKDIPDNSVVAGNPARIIRTLDESYFNEIM